MWRKIQDLGLASFYKEIDEIRVSTLVAFGLIPTDQVHFAFSKILETLLPIPLWWPFLSITRTRTPRWEHLGVQDNEPSHYLVYCYGTNLTKPCLIGSEKTDNSVKSWHRAFQHGMGFDHAISHLFNQQFSLTSQDWTKLLKYMLDKNGAKALSMLKATSSATNLSEQLSEQPCSLIARKFSEQFWILI